MNYEHQYFAAYVIGEPGSGKSTLLDHLTRALPHEDSGSPFPHRAYDCGVFEIGKRRAGGFSGTDALAMNIQPAVQQFIEGVHPKLLLAEGDRLANDKFFRFLIDAGYQLNVYVLVGPERAAVQRRMRGSQQDENWLKGRQTKVRRLTSNYSARMLAAGASLADLEHMMDDPVSEVLKAGRLVHA